ncbi:hypothetical protein EA462_02945 [Natrarchaeobius halalkaliphilus]|uniref:Uncharacterized protein n=1 Tax=Natrarchaeobius halalkaliphilus TaxID=1679091 RepID=A0A3N6PA20_9EURY|nr:hypothetical protein [Natrarchaeobius halalkaliphilus]RQG93175.1 hypothetical protein EA462_02945 [Natrarchaeobius halalkaliphilus]
MTDRTRDAAYTELDSDTWHQNDEGNYYIDCPECGSAASLMNVVTHGRCNAYLDRRTDDTELDERSMNCTATLWFELGYVSGPDDEQGADSEGASVAGPEATDLDAEDVETDDVDTGEGVSGEGQPPGADGSVDDDQQ